MTKIYLIKVLYFDEKENVHEVNFAAFTNLKKAKIYCEYKNLQIKLGKSAFSMMKSAKCTIETMKIWTADWSSELNKLQIENLPY